MIRYEIGVVRLIFIFGSSFGVARQGEEEEPKSKGIYKGVGQKGAPGGGRERGVCARNRERRHRARVGGGQIGDVRRIMYIRTWQSARRSMPSTYIHDVSQPLSLPLPALLAE